MRELKEGRRSSSSTSMKLPELPNEIIIEIGEKLSLKDVAKLMLCCRGLASQAKNLYEQRRRVDMSCFKSVTPSICNDLITHFSRSCLVSLHYCYDVHRHHKYDEETLEGILGYFSFSTHPEIDLYAGTPRVVDILAHGYFLHKFLSSQQQLQRLEMDKEREYVRVGEHKALVTLDIVGTNCPRLEYYWPDSLLFNPPHVYMAFLQRCPRLKRARFLFVLGIKDADTYAMLASPLELECAYFFFMGWHDLTEQKRRMGEANLRIIGSRLPRITAALVSFDGRGCMKEYMEFVKTMPRIQTLAFLRSFRPISEPVGPAFVDAFSLLRELHRAPLVVLLNGVPEEEFEKVVDVNAWAALPRGVEHVRIIFHWRSPSFDQSRQALLHKFINTAPLHLQTCSVFGVRSLFSEDYVFLKTLNRGNVAIKTALPFSCCFRIETMPC